MGVKPKIQERDLTLVFASSRHEARLKVRLRSQEYRLLSNKYKISIKEKKRNKLPVGKFIIPNNHIGT